VDDKTIANNLTFEAVQQFSKEFGVPASVVYTTYAGFKSMVHLGKLGNATVPLSFIYESELLNKMHPVCRKAVLACIEINTDHVDSINWQ